jgi:hypothetical protein
MIVTVKGVEVDVIKSSINPTFQSNDLNEIKNRNLSNTRLKFPKTPRNMEVFDYLGAQGSTSRVPYDIVKCEIRQGNNIQLKGVLKITADKGDYFEGILKEEAGDIFDLIKDKDLKDLDFSDLNHYLNTTTYSAATNSIDEYVYPIADYGAGFTDVLQVATQSPHLFKHYLWSKIWAEAGAYYSGVFFDNENYKSEVIGMAKGSIDVGKALVQNSEVSDSETFTTSLLTYDLQSTFLPLEMNDYYADDRIKINEDGEIEVLQKCKILLVNTFKSFVTQSTFSTPVGDITSIFEIKKNGVVIDTHTETESFTGTAPSWGALIEHTASFYSIADVGDVYTFETSSSVTSSITGTSADIVIYNNYKDSYIEILEPYIDFADLIGDMSQTAFIKDVISANGLMFKTVPSYGTTGDSSGLVYEFVTMEDLLNDRASAEDWSSKKSYTKVSKRSVGSYGLNNRLRYNYSEEVTPFLDYNHISTNLNQSDNNDLNQSEFEVSLVANSFLGVETLNPVMFEFVEVLEYEGTEGAQYLARRYAYNKALEVANKNAKVKLHNKTFTITDGNSDPPVDVSGLVSYLTNDRVEMDFYFERYFEAFSRIIDTPIKDTMAIYLTPLDIERLDFFKLKYFAQDGRYYYLNKVTKFKEGINTLCELVAVSGTDVTDYSCTDYQYNNFATTIYTP